MVKPGTACVLALMLVSLPCGCATRDRRDDEGATGAARERRAADARSTVETFVAALNRTDAQTAASSVDWNAWVEADPQLRALVATLKAEYTRQRPLPGELERRPIEGSKVTLREILDEEPEALARAAEEKFVAEMAKDLGGSARTTEARVVRWSDDLRETWATILMPNGEVIEFRLRGHSGDYRLVPRF